MAASRPGEESSTFRDAMADAEPLVERDKLRPAPKTVRRRKRSDPEGGAAFEVERAGEHVEGRAAGIDARILRRLRSGEFPVEARLDLHGLTLPLARRAVHETLSRVFDEGGRCVLVIHGRGRGSASGPVLKEALLGWIAEPPSGPRVMAWSSALGRHGGVGATYVLLRRER